MAIRVDNNSCFSRVLKATFGSKHLLRVSEGACTCVRACATAGAGADARLPQLGSDNACAAALRGQLSTQFYMERLHSASVSILCREPTRSLHLHVPKPITS
eukprot:6202857-Pleurochrysis_carterae.AAC.2